MGYIKIPSEELEALNKHIKESGFEPVLPVYYYKEVRGETYYFNSLGFPCKISKEFLKELKEQGRLKNWDGDEK